MLPIAQYLNNARGQVNNLARNIGDKFGQSNDELAMLNQSIMQKGIHGLSPEEKQLFQGWYTNPVMGATSPMNMSSGSETFVRNMARKLKFNQYVSPKEFDFARNLHDVVVPVGAKEPSNLPEIIEALRAFVRVKSGR